MPKTSRRLTAHASALREVQDIRVADLTSGVRWITLGGVQLREFAANGFAQSAFDSSGFDDDIRLLRKEASPLSHSPMPWRSSTNYSSPTTN